MPDLPPYLSISQVTTYLQCPRKFRFRYVDHLEPERRAPELALGSAVHATIGWWLEERVKGREPGETDIDRTYRVDWFSEGLGTKLALDEDMTATVKDLGRKLVGAFTTVFSPETLSPATKIEERFEVEVVDLARHRVLPVPLVGYYDFVDDGLIGEIKTSAKKASWRNWQLQLSAYSYARRVTTGRKPTVKLVELVKTKTPTAEAVDVVVPEVDERWTIEVVTEAYDSMRAGAFHPNPSFMCTKCEFSRACGRAA